MIPPVGDEITLSFDQSPLAEHGFYRRIVGSHALPAAPETSPSARDAARRGWEDRAQSEYVGVMVMRRFHGLLVDLNAPIDLQELALEMMLQEQRHTARCLEAARSLGSTGELSFELDELRQSRAHASPADDLMEMAVITFAIGEVVAQALLRQAISALPATPYRDILRGIAKDEVLHARIGVDLIARLRKEGSWPWLDYPGDAWLLQTMGRGLEAMRDRDVVRPEEAALFRDPSVASELRLLGIPPSDEFRAAYFAALERDVPRAFARIGINLRR
jgi:hypothetical protein